VYTVACGVQKKQRRQLREGSHSDAVLGLAWNREFRNVLASGSADKTIKARTFLCKNEAVHAELSQGSCL
jgi:periodic tryptophan protein 1